ncbi:hypothetical protein [Streptomyces sp. NPDC047071]|uniref:hypothetical protein n=1 Tax=Streptomyces sp. NPDC047071 TaxID=3154808 RepID=UPI00345464F9
MAVAMLSTTGARAQPANWSPRPHHRGLSLNARADRFLVTLRNAAGDDEAAHPRRRVPHGLFVQSGESSAPHTSTAYARRTGSRAEGLALRRQKIANGAAPAYSSGSENERADRRVQLGEHEQSASDRDSFLGTFSSIPPGMPGYDEATAEAAGKKP